MSKRKQRDVIAGIIWIVVLLMAAAQIHDMIIR